MSVGQAEHIPPDKRKPAGQDKQLPFLLSHVVQFVEQAEHWAVLPAEKVLFTHTEHELLENPEPEGHVKHCPLVLLQVEHEDEQF